MTGYYLVVKIFLLLSASLCNSEGVIEGKHRLHNNLDRDVRLYYVIEDPPSPDVEFIVQDVTGESVVDFGTIGAGAMKLVDLTFGHKFYAVDTSTGVRLNSVTLGRRFADYYFSTGLDADETMPFEERKEKWMREYKERTGLDWLSIWPRDPIIHNMYDPVEVGYTRTVTSRHGYWTDGAVVDNLLLEKGSELEFEIKTVSTSPAAFSVLNFLNDEEVEFLKRSAEGKLKRSVVSTKGVVSGGRTSESTWLTFNDILNHIYKRLGDLLGVEYKYMLNRKSAEDLMIVYYNTTKRYNDHVDWFDYDKTIPGKEYIAKGHNRLISIVMYLNDVEEGGHTAFPLSIHGPDTSVEPIKKSLVFFYDLLEDGNCDLKSRHAGRPPIRGEKYVGVTWVWDPEWRGGK